MGWTVGNPYVERPSSAFLATMRCETTEQIPAPRRAKHSGSMFCCNDKFIKCWILKKLKFTPTGNSLAGVLDRQFMSDYCGGGAVEGLPALLLDLLPDLLDL